MHVEEKIQTMASGDQIILKSPGRQQVSQRQEPGTRR